MAPLRHFQEFVLAILPEEQGYQARVIASPVGQASARFVLPYSLDELEAIDSSKWSSVQTLAGMSHQEFGTRLFDSVFAGPVAESLHRSLDRIGKDEGLRIVLRLTDVPELSSLPWEFLFDPQLDRFLGLAARTPVVRYLELPLAEPETLRVDPPLRILVVLSNPDDSPARLDVAEEWASVEQALSPLLRTHTVHIERLEPPTLSALHHRLQSEAFHIFHYVGHGDFDSQTDASGLLFENDEGHGHLVLADQLKVVVHNHPTLRLVFLNACHGAVSSLHNPFTGVAQSLVHQEVPAVIAMQGQISDRAAQRLAAEFYTALAHNYATDAALTEARVALFSAESLEWATPILYSRSKDNRLYAIALPPPVCPYPGMAPFARDQQRYFFGRKQEIREGIAHLRLHPFLTVIGPSGSGKSSLVSAGIVPAFLALAETNGPIAEVLTMRPGATPLARMAELFGVETAALSALAPATPVLLVIDQLEELFTQAESISAIEFLALINRLIGRPHLSILTTTRADFYPALMGSALWTQIQGNRLELAPLGREGLRAVIVKPSAAVGVALEEALVERLIADAAGDAGALPFLQETLVQMWDEMHDRTLTVAGYETLGAAGRSGLANAIARRANVTYGNLSPAGQTIARRIFLRLVQFGEGKTDFRRQMAVDDLIAIGEDAVLFDDVLQRLATDRLLTLSVNEQSGQRLADISHESLLSGWPLLAAWRMARKEAEQARRRFEARAEAYVQRNRTGGLLDEVELLEIERWLAGVDADELGGTSQALRGFVEDSQQALAAAKAREEAGRQRELLLERRARRRTQALAAVLAGLLLFFVAQTAQEEYLRWRTRQAGAVAAVVGQPARMETLEVSNQRYRMCVQAGRCTEPFRQFSTYFEPDNEAFPVAGVSGLQAARFCGWIDRRLPSRGEWLAAATNNGRTRYPWGSEPNPSPERANLLFGSDPPKAEMVGGRPAGGNDQGIEDMIGNVYEWTSTCFEDKAGLCTSAGEWEGAPDKAPARLFVMGGSFASGPSGIQSLENNAQTESVREFFGFRCAVDGPRVK